MALGDDVVGSDG
jgi:hypothetical protein